MYLALRDLRFARGRFSLIIVVVALMTLLVGFLTGLTGGLAMQNISAVLHLPAQRVVFHMPEEDGPSFASSSFSADEADEWAAAAGSEEPEPLGISTVLVEASDASMQLVLLAGNEPLVEEIPASPDAVVLGAAAAEELGVTPGDAVAIAGRTFTLERVVDDLQYSHRDVVWAQLDTWHQYLADTHQPEAHANVLLVAEEPADAAAGDTATGTTTQGKLESLLALEAFQSEIGSLAMMIGMLVLIAALVIGVFFLVWSMQRQRDVAVLKAVGASTGWLTRDALGQALLVLLLGTGIGAAATLGLGALAATALPFIVTWWSILLPAALMVLAGLIGAAVSLRQVTKVDPNTALAAAAA